MARLSLLRIARRSLYVAFWFAANERDKELVWDKRDMVFARSSGGTSTTDDEEEEAISKTDISVFPLATPLIAGPGAMGAAILLMADQAGDVLGQAIIISSILAIVLLAFISMLLAGEIQRLLGVTGMQVISRVMGVLLTALAIQFVFDGIKQSGLIGL